MHCNCDRAEQQRCDSRHKDFHDIVCMNERHARRWCRQRRWHTCGKNKGEEEERELAIGKRVKLVDTGQICHRACHCTVRKPSTTSHRRWYRHTQPHTHIGHTLAVHALIGHEESLPHAHCALSHTFSSLQHSTPAALLLTDIFAHIRTYTLSRCRRQEQGDTLTHTSGQRCEEISPAAFLMSASN